MRKKLAILDVDGTLFDGNQGIELLKVLIAKKLFPQKIGQEIFDWYEKYKSGEVEKAVVVDQCYQLYAKGMVGNTFDQIKPLAEKTWQLIASKEHSFTRPLVKLIKDNGFKVVLLSGSPMEMISVFGQSLGIDQDDLIAGTLEIRDTLYTGKIVFYPGSSKQKLEAIDHYLSKKRIEPNWQNSLAIGDNERDLGILQKVGLRFAFEPNERLKIAAKNQGFLLVDRQDILPIVKGQFQDI